MKNVTTIVDRIRKVNGQRVNYVELLTFACGAGTTVEPARYSRVQLTISSDSYDDQSFARSERWDGTQWHAVADIPGPSMKTKTGLAYQRGEPLLPADFAADRSELIALTKAVLG